MTDRLKPVETVSDITFGHIVLVEQVLQAIAKAGALNTVKLKCLAALDMKEYFDGVNVKLSTYHNFDEIVEHETAVHNSEVANMIRENLHKCPNCLSHSYEDGVCLSCDHDERNDPNFDYRKHKVTDRSGMTACTLKHCETPVGESCEGCEVTE